MKSIENYALKILAEAGCDCYTYGGTESEHLLSDLKEAFPDGMEYGYVDVANAILAISRPKPISRSEWLVQWDNDSCSDGYPVQSLEQGKCDVLDTLCEWMCQECYTWDIETGPTKEQQEDWDYMIYNCGVSVAQYNPMTDEYETVWEPDQVVLDMIGWKEFDRTNMKSLWGDISHEQKP